LLEDAFERSGVCGETQLPRIINESLWLLQPDGTYIEVYVSEHTRILVGDPSGMTYEQAISEIIAPRLGGTLSDLFAGTNYPDSQ